MTNCAEFRELVHDLVREEALDASVITAALNHAEACGACDALLGKAESLNLSLRSLAARDGSEQAPPHIENALLEKLAQKHAPAQRAGSRRRVWLASVAGIAAAVALFISLTLHHGGPQLQSLPEPQIAAAAGYTGYETEADDSADVNATDSFTSLSPAFDSASFDDATVVRVVLSDSALESFGLHSSEVGHGPVVADVVVASDGVPQAMRVVGW